MSVKAFLLSSPSLESNLGPGREALYVPASAQRDYGLSWGHLSEVGVIVEEPLHINPTFSVKICSNLQKVHLM